MNQESFTLTEAQAARDAGMAQAIDHAERVEPSWGGWAYDSLVCFCKGRDDKPFVAHQFITWAVNMDELPSPPTDKAFGAIFTKAARNGLIRKVGYRPHPLRHASPTVLWEVV